MLRNLAQSRAKPLGDICWKSGSRWLSTAPQQQATEAAGSRSPGLKRFLLALLPIAALAAAFESKHLQSERETAEREAAAVAAGQALPPRANIHGGKTSHGVEIDPGNPLHKVLPETECEFCLETREKLWGMVKAMKHEKKAAAKAVGPPAAEAAAATSSSGSSGASGGEAPAPAPAD
ncbi:hypothetical protein ABPG75_013949 [Micractinium tetrahymenae]